MSEKNDLIFICILALFIYRIIALSKSMISSHYRRDDNGIFFLCKPRFQQFSIPNVDRWIAKFRIVHIYRTLTLILLPLHLLNSIRR